MILDPLIHVHSLYSIYVVKDYIFQSYLPISIVTEFLNHLGTFRLKIKQVEITGSSTIWILIGYICLQMKIAITFFFR